MSTEAVLWILAAGLATSIGGLGILLLPGASQRGLDVLLGFTAGIMLAATAFSLLVPALDLGALWEVVLGFALGGGTLAVADRFVPHLHLRFLERRHTDVASRKTAERAGLLLAALTIHNVPEGLAVGVAFAAGGSDLGVPIALAIGIQNIPEGFAAAAPLVETGVSRRRRRPRCGADGSRRAAGRLRGVRCVRVRLGAAPRRARLRRRGDAVRDRGRADPGESRPGQRT